MFLTSLYIRNNFYSARDSNVFTVSVNVEPQSKVTFNLTYEQLLTRTLGLYENIVNVNPGQVKFKYKTNIIFHANRTSFPRVEKFPGIRRASRKQAANSCFARQTVNTYNYGVLSAQIIGIGFIYTNGLHKLCTMR